MPKRKVIFANKEIYHVYNRTIDEKIIFRKRRESNRALKLLDYYRFSQTKRYSQFLLLSNSDREVYFNKIKKTGLLVELIAFCLMPTHYHILIKQIKNKGVVSFISNFQNSFAKYFNIKNNRSGSLFQNMFKAKRIKNEESLIHVSRYIHLNPVTSYLIDIGELEHYPLTSFQAYCSKSEALVSSDLILGIFKTTKKYKKFVYDQKDYQRQLQKIKNLANFT